MDMNSVAVLLLLYLISTLHLCSIFINATEANTIKGVRRNSSISKDSLEFAAFAPLASSSTDDIGENETPIIGILSIETSKIIKEHYPEKKIISYIPASYVKFVEGAGGRVLPIWIGKSREYYEDILSKVNGVILPGASSFLNISCGYAHAGQHIYDIAIAMNKRGIYMPIWGTCLGFHLMVFITANNTDLRVKCESSTQALSLEFKRGFTTSRLFMKAPQHIIGILKKYPITTNSHKYCLTEELLTKNKLNEVWTIISLNHDWNGLEFISCVEHKRYPFYGFQFHPEKSLYEFIANRSISHTTNAVIVAQYFANFFMGEARKNHNHFLNETEEFYSLIYNYKPVYTAERGLFFVQQYFFEQQEYSYSIHNIAIILSYNMLLLLLIGTVTLYALDRVRRWLLI